MPLRASSLSVPLASAVLAGSVSLVPTSSAAAAPTSSSSSTTVGTTASTTAAATGVRAAGAGLPTLKPWPGHPGRHLVGYRVRRGDSATSIAARFHAWTAELLRINHKNRASAWRVGEHVTVPVVTARAGGHRTRPASHVPRTRVRDEIVRVARQQGVSPRLALAVAWQESGWQQHVRSSVGAIGAMQVMPGTGRWLSSVAGRRLHLTRLHDNVTAGVLLIKLLRRDHGVRRALAGYYQGLGSIADHGTYPSTKRYVRNVLTHRSRLERGWRPLASV